GRAAGVARPAVGDTTGGVAGAPPGGAAAWYLSARREVHPVERADLRAQGGRRVVRVPGVRTAARPAPPAAAGGRGGRRRHRPEGSRRQSAQLRAGYPPPSVLPSVPGPVRPDDAP